MSNMRMLIFHVPEASPKNQGLFVAEQRDLKNFRHRVYRNRNQSRSYAESVAHNNRRKDGRFARFERGFRQGRETIRGTVIHHHFNPF